MRALTTQNNQSNELPHDRERDGSSILPQAASHPLRTWKTGGRGGGILGPARNGVNANQACAIFIFEVLIWISLPVPLWFASSGGTAGLWDVRPACAKQSTIVPSSNGSYVYFPVMNISIDYNSYCELESTYGISRGAPLCLYIAQINSTSNSSNQSSTAEGSTAYSTPVIIDELPAGLEPSIYSEPIFQYSSLGDKMCKTSFRNGIISGIFLSGFLGAVCFLAAAGFLYVERQIKYKILWVPMVTCILTGIAVIIGWATNISGGTHTSYNLLIIAWVITVLVACSLVVTFAIPGAFEVQDGSQNSVPRMLWRPPRAVNGGSASATQMQMSNINSMAEPDMTSYWVQDGQLSPIQLSPVDGSRLFNSGRMGQLTERQVNNRHTVPGLLSSSVTEPPTRPTQGVSAETGRSSGRDQIGKQQRSSSVPIWLQHTRK